MKMRSVGSRVNKGFIIPDELYNEYAIIIMVIGIKIRNSFLAFFSFPTLKGVLQAVLNARHKYTRA